MAEKKSTRIAYGEALKKLGEVNGKVIACDADLAHATMSATFADAFPDRFYNFGIAESNLMAASAGLAHCGYTVYASTFAVFGTGRAFEQVRNAICYTKANVKLCLSHSGPSAGEDGGSHQAIEDIALMRTLPNMTVIVPCDAVEIEKAVFAAAEIDGPVFIRTGRIPTDIVTDADTPFVVGKANVLREGTDVAIIACGTMVPQAVLAAEQLSTEGISARVINMHTIKPLDVKAVKKAAAECKAIVTAEEHSVIGGLGTAVAEVLADNTSVPFERVGIMDHFGESGTPAELFEKFGLTDRNIVSVAKKLLAWPK